MSRLVGIGVVVVMVAFGVAFLVPAISRLRATNEQLRTQHDLREIYVASQHWFAAFPDMTRLLEPQDTLPPGTVPNAVLEPEQRLSWFVLLLPALDQKRLGAPTLFQGIDPKGAWDAEGNVPAGRRRLKVLLSPAKPPPETPGEPAPTQYVGLGGLGADGPRQPFEGPGSERTGIFRYDVPTPGAAITDGRDVTLMVGETNRDRGPWIRGGPSTVRGIDPAAERYIGEGEAFGGFYPGGGYFLYGGGAAKFFVEGIDPRVFRALVLIRDGAAGLKE
jgi:hypothetical protein